MECESKILLRHCNCIMYYMPKVFHNVSICGKSEESCISKMKDVLKTVNENVDCDCLPSCNSVDYDSELSSAPILNPVQLFPKLNDQEIQNLSILQVFFRENSFRAQKRKELFGFTEFLCNLNKENEMKT